MADPTFILLIRPTGWCIDTWPRGCSESFESLLADITPIPDMAGAIALELQSRGYTGGPVAIGIPAAWCLSALISLADLPRGDVKAMLYRLEEHLPLPAESVIADFVSGESGEWALGVCVRVDTVVPLVKALENAGVAVQSIVPTALLTAQAMSQTIQQSTCLLLTPEPDGGSKAVPRQMNVIALRAGLPTHWSLITASAADFKLQLDLLSTDLGSVPHIQAIDLPAELADAFVEVSSTVIADGGENASSLATAFAAEVLQGSKTPWVEFRRGRLAIGDPLRLHRKWIDASLAAAIVLLLSLTLVFILRSFRYDQSEQSSAHQMIAAFTEHFPGWDVPPNVRAVVDAQYRRAQGAGDPATSRLASASALSTLHDVLLPLMAEEHFQIEKMAFHENAFEISGKLQSYEQVDALAKLARAGGMQVSPAQTRKDTDGTWTFSLQGSRPAPSTPSDRPAQD